MIVNGWIQKYLSIAIFIALGGYSAAILITEWRTSQDHVRLYLGDIDGPVFFYLINTSLSVFLLGATAVVFYAALRAFAREGGKAGHEWGGSLQPFLLSQIGIFSFLAFDDRFQFHEELAVRLGDIPDHFVLAAVAALEVVFLIRWAPHRLLFEKAGRWFIAGTAGFAVMFAIDALGPEDGRLRLSAEDLVKTWAAWFFFVAAWSLFEMALDRATASRRQPA